MASSYGELIERLQTNNSFSDFYLPNRKHYPDEVAFELGGAYLDEKLKEMYNPSGELEDEDLIDFNSDNDESVVALPFLNLQTKEEIYFPVNILANLYVSNGLASGNTTQEAQIQALSEIIERHVKFEVIKNGYSLPPYESLSKYPKLTSDMELLREKGYIVNAHDSSLGGKFPVTAISLINPANGTLFVSFGSHPLFEVSLERTMTELMQGRDLDALDSFEVPTFDMELVSSSMNMESHFVDSNGKMGMGFLSDKKSFELSPWAYSGDKTRSDMDSELSFLTTIIYGLGKSIYMREYSHLGFYSTQIIVPEFSEVYAIDELIDNNKNRGKAVRDAVLNFCDYDPADILDTVEELNDAIDVGSYIGVIFARGFSMLEFKIQLYILGGDGNNALNALGYMSERTPLQNAIFELLILRVLEKDINEYENGLKTLFTADIYNKATEILECRANLIDLAFDEQYEDILAMYDRVYAAHNR
jgi:ribosomal protein S12 methylthiotransferase accessory factor